MKNKQLVFPLMIISFCLVWCVLQAIIDVTVFKYLVEWFVLPLHKETGQFILNISMPNMIGLFMIKSYLFKHHAKQTMEDKIKNSENPTTELIGTALGHVVLIPVLVLSVGYFLKAIM